MTAVHNTNFSAPNSSGQLDRFAADGVCLSTQVHAGATVVVATGELDASNMGHLTDYVSRYLTGDRALVLDLSQLDFLAAQGVRTLFELDEDCARDGIGWAVLPGDPVTRLLRICDKDARLPTVSSIDEALERFSRAAPAHRSLKLVT